MNRRTVFTVPAAAGTYATEVLYLNDLNDVRALMDVVSELTLEVEALAGAGAQVEVDLLRAGGLPGTATDWRTAAKAFTTTGLKDPIGLSAWVGVRVRVKSGGAAGSTIVNAAWF